MASAGCVGELCAFLSEEELKMVLLQHLLGKYLYENPWRPLQVSPTHTCTACNFIEWSVLVSWATVTLAVLHNSNVHTPIYLVYINISGLSIIDNSNGNLFFCILLEHEHKRHHGLMIFLTPAVELYNYVCQLCRWVTISEWTVEMMDIWCTSM